MKESLRVSVILPTFNRERYLADSITSILDQTKPPLEILVVDDGSTDSTPEICSQFSPSITYIRQDNAGKLTAIATGLDKAGGDLVWIMDDDDIAAPDALERLTEPFARDPELVLSYGKMTRFDEGAPQSREEVVEYPDDRRPFLVRLMEDCFITGHPCVLVRRDALEQMRPFDSEVLASVDYYLHLGVAIQGPVAFVDRVVLRQRQHSGLRGPRTLRYAEGDRNAKWIAHDAYLLKKLLSDLPQRAYLSPPPWSKRRLTAAEQRMALIQKSVIAGRKKLWPDAIDSLDAALDIMRDTPLRQDELNVLAGMLGCRYGISEVHEAPDILHELYTASVERDDRTRILTALSRPLLHEIKIAWRQLDATRAAQAVRSWFRLMDVHATWCAFQSAVGRNLGRMATRSRAS